MRKSMLLIPLLVLSCFSRKDPPAFSDAFSEAQSISKLTEKKLSEVSGLAASIRNPGLLWTHNDSGNPAVVYLVDEKLNIRLACKLAGIKNRDWEDIAVGPGPDPRKRYVYVADIGDNNARYDTKYLYRFEEPAVGDANGEITITNFDTIAFRLEDGMKDTEAIMIHPVTRNIYIVSKRESPVHLYEIRYPYPEKEVLTARSVASLPLTQIVAATISGDGHEILMKNYDFIYYWKSNRNSVPEVLAGKPQLLQYSEEPQGEAITFKPDGSGFYTLSEKIKGEDVFLYFYKRSRVKD